MILNIFILLLALSVVFILIGYFSLSSPLQMMGFTFMFILGLVLMFGGLQYEKGFTEFYKYGDNYSAYHWDYDTEPNPSKTDLNIFHTNRTIVYENFDSEIVGSIKINHFFGLFLSIISFIGFITVLFNLGAFEKEKTEYDND